MDILDNEPPVAVNSRKKKFLGIYFSCCNVYGRIYNYSGKQYEGKCPRCLRHLTIKIGSGGVGDRFFIAS
ncbi:MAG: hypothetical protein ACUZ8N_10865 [Candidatus Scalindua sp.]